MARMQTTSVTLRQDQLEFLDGKGGSNSMIIRQALDKYMGEQ